MFLEQFGIAPSEPDTIIEFLQRLLRLWMHHTIPG